MIWHLASIWLYAMGAFIMSMFVCVLAKKHDMKPHSWALIAVIVWPVSVPAIAVWALLSPLKKMGTP